MTDRESCLSRSEGPSVAIAGGCPEAVDAALAVYRNGGTVVDAAIAGAWVQAVAMPHATSIGGDLFALVRVDGKVKAINATGATPRRATIETFRRLGLARVPATGPLSIQPPGLVAGLALLARHGAVMSFSTLMEPAIALAEAGTPVRNRLAGAIAAAVDIWAGDPAWTAVFAPGGRSLKVGDRLRQPALAETLKTIATKGPQAFYEGTIARDICESVQRRGGLMEPADLASVMAIEGEPLRTDFAGYSIATQPPVSQGVVLLRALCLLKPALGESDENRVWLRAVNALRQAFGERLAFLGDSPDAGSVAARLLDDSAPALSVDTDVWDSSPNTTLLALADARGNAVSVIQSVFADLGSGVVCDESGILLNNRLSAFFLDPSHSNALRPGRATMHTLHTFMVERGGDLVWAGGSPGGDRQPQVNLQVLTRLLARDRCPESAVMAPRWSIAPGTDPHDLSASRGWTLEHEPALEKSLVSAFAERGFVPRSIEGGIGCCKLVRPGNRSQGPCAWTDDRREAATGGA